MAITWNLFFTTSRGWQTALENVPAANPQRNNWKLDKLLFDLDELKLESLYLFQDYKQKRFALSIEYYIKNNIWVWVIF